MANKWIHEYGQEFQHPCSLNPEEWEGLNISWAPWSTRASLYNWEAHLQAKRKEAAKKWTHRQGRGEPWKGSLHLWFELRAPGSLERTADSAAVDLDSTTPRGGVERNGTVGNRTLEGKCSLAPTGQFMQMERDLWLCTLCWFQLTVQGFLPLAFLKTYILCSSFPTMDPLKGLSLQINKAEPCVDSQNFILKCVNAKFIKIIRMQGWMCINWCIRHLKISIRCDGVDKNKCLF